MDEAFKAWFNEVIRKWEGGTAERDIKADSGGLTRHGVTIGYWINKAHKIVGKPPTREGLMSISWNDAEKIAYQDFWLSKKINTIANKSFRPIVADTYWLGGGISSLGYPSIAALNNNKLETARGLYNKRLAHLKNLSNWDYNKNGWTNRMKSVLNAALSMSNNKTKLLLFGGVAITSFALYYLNRQYKWI